MGAMAPGSRSQYRDARELLGASAAKLRRNSSTPGRVLFAPSDRAGTNLGTDRM